VIRGKVRAVGIAATVAATLALSACQSSGEPLPRSATPVPERTISKGTLALQARIVYERYLKAVEEASEKGVSRYDLLKSLATPKAYAAEVKSLEAQRVKGIHTSGPSNLIKFQIQSVDVASGHVVAYACVDLSKVKVLQASGTDVTPASRPNRQTSLPSFQTSGGILKLDVNGSWSGESIC
jgi:hypothetical protein